MAEHPSPEEALKCKECYPNRESRRKYNKFREKTMSDFDKATSEPRELTYGEEAVGITFNPARNADVNKAKELCAELIDLLREHQLQPVPANSLKAEELGAAIEHIKTAQMWAVKAITRGL